MKSATVARIMIKTSGSSKTALTKLAAPPPAVQANNGTPKNKRTSKTGNKQHPPKKISTPRPTQAAGEGCCGGGGTSTSGVEMRPRSGGIGTS